MQVQALTKLIQENPELEQKIKSDPVGAIQTIGAMPLQTDVWVYRLVVFCLGAGVLSAMVGALTLSFYGKPTPEVVTALGSAAVGALAGLLAPSPGRS